MKKILTFGVFDVFHLGHLRLFKQCLEYGDYLIVAIQDEKITPEYKPGTSLLYSNDERMELITSLRQVSEAILYDHVSIKTLEKIDFDILALGEDHIGERFDTVSEWCINHGKEVVRLKRTPNISSSKIKRGIK